ncbi:uncharacterized protein LOC120090738 [Benincasa hispida]|uniref:uncharacterized protein LOC120090738 n=1 Tax=Benincasa hispida TaxID=102211 RepID=UPI001900E757|nr:uncharacterized protein LOC120090738 [Benincasa hispida]
MEPEIASTSKSKEWGTVRIQLPPFLQRLKKNKNDEVQYQRFMDMLKQLYISIPFTEVIKQMPKYTKFLKDMVTKKRSTGKFTTVVLTQSSKSIIPPKMRDPGSFTIPCSIGGLYIGQVLCDLGATINLIPLSIFKQLNVGQLAPTMATLQLADRSLVHPEGKIDMYKEEITLSVNGQNLRFDIIRAMKYPKEEDLNESDDEPNQENTLLSILRKYIKAIGWMLSDIREISPEYYMHRIRLEDNQKGSIEHQRRLKPTMKEVMKKKIIKWLGAGIIYPIANSKWISPVQCVPKKGGVMVVPNANNELIPMRTVTGWRICMDYCKLNVATKNDHFPLPFIGQMLDHLAGNAFYCFLDGYAGYNQIMIAPKDQEKTTFICPYGRFAFRRMLFGLCNVPSTF